MLERSSHCHVKLDPQSENGAPWKHKEVTLLQRKCLLPVVVFSRNQEGNPHNLDESGLPNKVKFNFRLYEARAVIYSPAPSFLLPSSNNIKWLITAWNVSHNSLHSKAVQIGSCGCSLAKKKRKNPNLQMMIFQCLIQKYDWMSVNCRGRTSCEIWISVAFKQRIVSRKYMW